MIGRYPKGTRDKGIILKPEKDKIFNCWVDTDFTGNWREEDHEGSHDGQVSLGWTITYAGCLVTWSSKLQTLMALSTTKAEYVLLSSALHDQIPLMEIMKGVIEKDINIHDQPPKVHCTAFKDNHRPLELVRLPKICA